MKIKAVQHVQESNAVIRSHIAHVHAFERGQAIAA